MQPHSALLLFAVAGLCDAQKLDLVNGSRVTSPDNRYAIVSSAAGTAFTHPSQISFVSLSDGKAQRLFTADRVVQVVWSSRSREVAINDIAANSGDFLYAYRIEADSTLRRLRRPNQHLTEHKLVSRHPKFRDLVRWSLYAERWIDRDTVEALIRGENYTNYMDPQRRDLKDFAYKWTIRFTGGSNFKILNEIPTTF